MSKCSYVINLFLPCKDVIQYPNKVVFFLWFGYFIQSNQAFIFQNVPTQMSATKMSASQFPPTLIMAKGSLNSIYF